MSTTRIVLPDLNLAAAERLICTEALAQSGSIVEAAQLLGINRHALKRKMLRHAIEWPVGYQPKKEVAA